MRRKKKIEDVAISVKAGENISQWLERVALEESTVRCRLTASDVVRAALRYYAEEYEKAPEDFDPAERGQLRNKWVSE